MFNSGPLKKKHNTTPLASKTASEKVAEAKARVKVAFFDVLKSIINAFRSLFHNKAGLYLVTFLFLLTGLFLYVFFDKEMIKIHKLSQHTYLLHHLGLAIMDAAMITIIFSIREFQDFFEGLATRTMLKKEYVESLGQDERQSLRIQVASAMIKPNVDNGDFNYVEMLKSIDDLIFKNWLPADEGSHKFYRKDYRYSVFISYISVKVFVREVFDRQEADDIISKIENIDKYCVIRLDTKVNYKIVNCSKKTDAGLGYCHELQFEINSFELDFDTHIPMEKRAKFLISDDDFNYTDCSFIEEEDLGGVKKCRLATDDTFFSYKDGECEVWVKSTQYLPSHGEKSLNVFMRYMTKNSRMSVRQGRDSIRNLKFNIGMIAPRFIKKHSIPKDGNNQTPPAFSVSYEDWLLEGNAFVINWWES